MHNQFSNLPYDSRNLVQAGVNQGTGLPFTVGKKAGGFTDDRPSDMMLKSKPPRKI